MRVCIGGALAVLAAAAVAAAGAEEGGGLAAGLQLALSTYRQCESAAGAGGEAAGSDAAGADALACLKMHALRALQRALAKDALPLADGLALVRAGPAAAEDGAAEENAAEAAAAEAEAGAGAGAGERRQARLDALLAAHATRLLRSRALAVSVPRVLAALLPDEEAGEEQGAQEEGRRQSGLGGLGGGGGGGGGLGGLGGKRRGGKKGHGAMLLAMLMKGSMIAYAYKALAVVAGKALLVAKVALVLASVMGLSHLVGHKAPATTYEIVKQPVVHGYHQLDDHHHFDVADIHGHGGGFGGGGGGGAGGGAGGGGGWGRAAVGRSLSAGAGPAAPPPASPPPASQLVAPEAATTPEAAAPAAAA